MKHRCCGIASRKDPADGNSASSSYIARLAIHRVGRRSKTPRIQLSGERGIDAIQMEAIAKRAGVSRATAFRQLGSLSEAVMQVALLRAERHMEVVRRLMEAKTGAFEKLEAALVYNVRELPKDPAITALMARRGAASRRGSATERSAPPYRLMTSWISSWSSFS